MPAKAVICAQYGYDIRTGRHTSTGVTPRPPASRLPFTAVPMVHGPDADDELRAEQFARQRLTYSWESGVMVFNKGTVF